MNAGIQARAQELLVSLTGRADATFREDQLEAITAIVERRQRVLLVQRTGWGKSAVYFIATKLLRDAGAGPTLLISPLLALMRNQIEAAARMGVQAETINSSNTDTWDETEEHLLSGAVDLLLVSPERLANPSFRSAVLPVVARSSGLLVVDEAHCISDWGHDFRPDYRRIVRVLDLLPPNVPVLCCTATANNRVVRDIQDQLGNNLTTLRGGLGRDGLALHVVQLATPAERMQWLVEMVPALPGSGIVYCLTVLDTERVARWLQKQGVTAAAYHGGSDTAERPVLEQALLDNEYKVVVATSALGMGFDKPDLAFVIHFQHPGSPVAYYQQVGRAGRQITSSNGVLLVGAEAREIQDWFISTAFPSEADTQQVIALLAAADAPMSVSTIEANVNLRRTRLLLLLKTLEVDGAITRTKSGYQRTLQPWAYDKDRIDGVTKARRDEQDQMQEYIDTAGCRMLFLRRLLDDDAAQPCGVCDRCADSWMVIDLEPADVAAAQAFLRGQPISIDPRVRWPTGLGEPSGRIRSEQSVEPGLALCLWGDGGWGAMVRDGKYRDHVFADELVEAAANAIRAWSPAPDPTWVTCVPSLRRDQLVQSFSRRLAERLGIDFIPAVTKARETEPQKGMENSAQQVRNLWGAFSVVGAVPSSPVLLVDDIFDSRWTMTVVGAVLRDAGVSAVIPFALAKATGD